TGLLSPKARQNSSRSGPPRRSSPAAGAAGRPAASSTAMSAIEADKEGTLRLLQQSPVAPVPPSTAQPGSALPKIERPPASSLNGGLSGSSRSATTRPSGSVRGGAGGVPPPSCGTTRPD